jgi:hypothetical protein
VLAIDEQPALSLVHEHRRALGIRFCRHDGDLLIGSSRPA